MITREPGFYREFHCLGGGCPFTCCQHWEIVVDSEALADYAAAPEGLRQEIARSLVLCETGETCFRLTGDHQRCAMLDGDGLCTIQRRWGQSHLCAHCGAYPRWMEEYGCLTENSLAVSCPEAARLTLERGIFPLHETDDGKQDPPFDGVDSSMLEGLTASRETAFRLLGSPGRSLWTRLAAVLDYAAALQKRIDLEEPSKLGRCPPPAWRGDGEPERLRQLAVCLLACLAELEPLRPQWPALLRERGAALQALSPSAYAALVRDFAAAHPRWEDRWTHMAEALLFHHWPKAVNDDGLYPRAALTAAACVALYHLLLLGDPGQSAEEERILWVQFSREVEHDEENFFTLAEELGDESRWPLAEMLG